MNKKTLTFLIVCTILLVLAIMLKLCVDKFIVPSWHSENNNQDSDLTTINFDEIQKDFLEASEWVDITENDKITFAFNGKTELVSRLITSLEKNNYVICYVVGGRFNPSNDGTYIVLKGFDNDGKIKILAGINEFKEKSYIFERVLENTNKILFFDKEVDENE